MEIKPTQRAIELLIGSIATDHDMRDVIAGMIEARGSQKAVALDLGISPTFLREIMIGSKPISGEFAAKLGWEKLTIFRRIAPVLEGGIENVG